MKSVKKLISLLLAAFMLLSLSCGVFAAEVAEATIDPARTGSISLYKYDLTNAEKDGVWNSSYVSTGVYDQNVNDTLGGATRAGATDSTSALGNGQASSGYAIKGVEFTYLRVADIATFTESANDQHPDYNLTQVLYGFDKAKSADLLKAIGLTADDRYKNADTTDKLNHDNYYFNSHVLNTALRTALATNATTVKNALEAYVKQGGTAMELTDSNGYTTVAGLPLGLYLMVETKVPEMVTATVNPFFVSLPMTSINGTNATNGGQEWLYDVTLYPKNETGIPTLEKTVREAQADTGKNTATSVITDGYAHNATGSAGDVMEYQIISTLPSITSTATQLTTYSFIDTLSKGLTYTRGDVVLEWFKDAACTEKEKIATWKEADGKFTVTYLPATAADDQENKMTIAMTGDGLKEINTAATVYKDSLRRGYSDCTLRITYTATIDTNATTVYGDSGNPNAVVLTWKRTSSDFYDTLEDDAHVYTYGIDLTKLFVEDDGSTVKNVDWKSVNFVLFNQTDGYWVKAELNTTEGIYYVTDHLAGTADVEAAGRTLFTPVTTKDAAGKAVDGKIIIKGLEDDTYILTEVTTADRFALLKDPITIVISQKETDGLCDVYANQSALGVIQNDPRYATIMNAANVDTSLGLNNMPQKHLDHHLLTASATVDGNAVTMLVDNGSPNALVPLTVVNTRDFWLPDTGENMAILLPRLGMGICAVALVGMAALLICGKKRKEEVK